MIKEAYVSFEVAKILKEKGFNDPCLRVYDKNGIISIRYLGFDIPHNYTNSLLYLCPTHQMAMAWLREEKNCIISIWYTGVCYASDYYIKDDNEEIHDIIGTYETYNEAVEKSLKDVLTNLI